MIILSVDPGAAGGICVCDNGVTRAHGMPATEGDILVLIRNATATTGPGVAYMEEIVKHMGLGIPASTMAVYASNYGFMKGALMMAGWRLELVRPQVWQKELGLGITGRQKANIKGMTKAQANVEKARIRKINSGLKRDWKNKLKSTAQRLFPDIEVTLETSDALLILRYGQLREGHNVPRPVPLNPVVVAGGVQEKLL